MANENHENKNKLKGGKKADKERVIQWVVIGILAVVILYSGARIMGTSAGTGVATGIGVVSAADIMPTGIPAVYGKELGISYSDVNPNNQQTTEAVINKLASYEGMQLDNATMQRYIRIGSSIACEYCCGAQTLIFSNGERACDCAHSYAMRGLIKYLLVNHPEMTDLQILNEVGKWKVLFFPGPEETKAQALTANGISYTANQSAEYVTLASNEYRGIESQQASASSGSGNLASQVGGC